MPCSPTTRLGSTGVPSCRHTVLGNADKEGTPLLLCTSCWGGEDILIKVWLFHQGERGKREGEEGREGGKEGGQEEQLLGIELHSWWTRYVM